MLGGPDFVPALLAHGWTRVGASHVSMIGFGPDLSPTISLAGSRDGSDTSVRAAAIYTGSLLHRHDPLLSAIADGDETRPVVTRLTLDDIADTEHRRLYADFGLSERFAILGCQKGAWSSLSFYRDADAPPLADVSPLVEEATLLHALATRHLRLMTDTGFMPAESKLADLLGRLEPRLSGRQVQVCSRALCGLTNAEIAGDLGIEVSTVSTLRRRAYDRLEVTSLAELFRRCLAVAMA